MLHLGIIDLIFLYSVDIILECRAAGIIVVVLMIFAARRLDDERAPRRLKHETEFLGDAAALARQAQTHAAADHLARSVDLRQLARRIHHLAEGARRVGDLRLLEHRLVVVERRGAEEQRKPI